MSETVEAAMTVQIRDASVLHSFAVRSFIESGGHQDEADAWLGTPDRPEIPNCVLQLIGQMPDGCGAVVRECSARTSAPGRDEFRTVTTACVSTSHLTNEELLRIDSEFEIERCGDGRTCRNEIVHDGLRTNPIDSGFVVRIPPEDAIKDIRHLWTPEMAIILDIAMSQGARRVEFHAEECEIEGIQVHEH